MRQSRFAIVAWMAGVYLVVAQVTRCVLAASLPADAGVGLRDVVPIGAIGLLYDLCFVAYASIVPVLFVATCPSIVWRSPITRAALHVVCFATIYGFGFIVAAEYLFWGEFSARFNFISVDYLVYRREVTNNIAESYPVVAIFSGIAVATIAIYALLARRFDAALRNDGPARSRWRTAAAWLALPVAAYFGVGQELRDRVGDNYARELASDGPYQFVAAFRNNELDYVQFYQSVDSDHAVAVLKEDLGAAPDDYVEPHSRSILRRVHAAGDEHRYNVILVMVESLSAEYLARFTPGSTLTPNLDALIGESLFFNR
ncbi:MAG TPA: LTA synthase family protein, partial [Pseudomonadales bacterium]|nr:LTA synthase family protein [Pseudomonadales bacterium]